MTDAQSSTIFVSPSTLESGDLIEALRALETTFQERFERFAADVSSWVAPGSLVRRSVGVWDDGAEPSACLEVPATATIEDLQYIASLIGVKFRQKDVLIFSPEGAGRDFMHRFAARAPVQLLAEELQSASIGNRTYVLERDGGLEVFVYDDRFDPELQRKLASVTGAYGYDLHTTQGKGRFVTGLNDSRDEAGRVFLTLIRAFERRYPDRKYPIDRR